MWPKAQLYRPLTAHLYQFKNVKPQLQKADLGEFKSHRLLGNGSCVYWPDHNENNCSEQSFSSCSVEQLVQSGCCHHRQEVRGHWTLQHKSLFKSTNHQLCRWDGVSYRRRQLQPHRGTGANQPSLYCTEFFEADWFWSSWTLERIHQFLKVE